MEASPDLLTQSNAGRVLTHSRLSCFRACPRRHFIRYELGISPDSDGAPRRIGSAFHAALETRDAGGEPEEAIRALEDPFEMATVSAMFAGHVARWNDSPLEVVASELQFENWIVNPSTGHATPTWLLAGKIDRIIRLADGRLAIQEYKTTSRDFAPGADYWLRLHLDQQLSLYIIAARQLGYQVETILYDVTRRPLLRPFKATPEEARKYTKDGKLYANQRTEDETPEAFHLRLSEDIAARPDHYFTRMPIARLDQDLDDCRAELWQQQRAIREAQLAGRWYRNPGACFEPFACDYITICQNRDLEANTPAGFSRSSDIHPELSGYATNEG